MSAPGTTSGPWSVNPNTFHEPVIRASNGYAVAVAKVDFGGCSNSSEKDAALDTRKANAHLIAAAPDYAEAAELMIAAEQSGGDLWWKGFEMLKAAHAKARGEQS